MNDYSVIDLLKKHVEQNPQHIIYRFLTYIPERDDWDIQEITFRSLYQRALGIAHVLQEKKIRRGDRVVIFSMQDDTTVYSILGCILAGVTFTVIPPPIDEGKAERFISVVKSCRPKALISNFSMEQAAGSSQSLAKRLAKEALFTALRMKRIYADQIGPYFYDDVIRRIGPEDLIYLQYTSGSTSAPKGVRITRRNLEKQLEQCDHAGDFHHGRLGTWVPFFHNLGLVVTILMPVCMESASVYFLSTLQFLSNPRLWVRMLSEFKLNLTVGPGSAFDACTRIFTREEADRYELSHMTHLMNGSEYISAASVHQFVSMFHLDPNSMTPGYGLAENTCLASFTMREYRELRLDQKAFQNNRVQFSNAPDAKAIVSIGRPVKDLTILVGSPKSGKVFPDLRIGEILISGDSVADGYWGNPPANRNFHIRMNGYPGREFYRTGDLGFLYDGHLYITGRRKEMLIVNGHNIYPNDLQILIRQKVPALAASTIGFFSVEKDGKERMICVIECNPEDDFEARISQVNAAVSEHFGFSFYDMVFVPFHALPRTDNNKLQTARAKTMYEENKLQVLHSSRSGLSGGTPEGGLIDKSIDLADEVLQQVKSVFSHVLKIDHFSLTDSFLELGGDSLMGFELLNSIEQKFHVKLDFRALLRDSSVVGISNYLKAVMAGQIVLQKSSNLADECRLDPQICVTSDYSTGIGACNKILLTGATGFLGAHLIDALIRRYPRNGLEIHCLVRADSAEDGRQRLIRNMKHYHLWKDSYDRYLYPVIGDLSSRHLGIPDPQYIYLSNRIQTVIHNGALLNFVFPYEYLKPTNVGGTVETLRFACDGQPKYYQFISSYSVYDTPNNVGKRVYENDPLLHSKGFSLAYSETKWVSEKLVGIARRRGLKATVYRPGDITGASNGIWAVEDMVSRIIVGIIQMKCIPRTSYCMHMTPVNYVADAIACISRKPESVNEAFNIINPKSVPIRELVAQIRKCGYPVQYVPFLLWRHRLKQADSKDNSLAVLECLFESGTETNPGILRHFTGIDTTYDTSQTSLLLNGSGIRCPAIDRKMIAAYLRYFEKLGYIHKNQ